MKVIRSIVTLVLTLSMIGCGAIIHGTKENIGISAPAGAVVSINGMRTQGSSVMRLDRDTSYSVTMEKGGKTRLCGQITSSLSAGVLIADILLGLWPVVIDAATGAWYNLEPTQVMCME